MTTARGVDGVMKWVRREEWRSAFEEVLGEHLGAACERADIDPEDLPSLIGGHWFLTLWGCAFEDFMSRDLEDDRNIVDDYLKRRGWKESASNKAYLAGLRASVMSLYEVSDIVPGRSFLARDLIRGGDPIRITEHTATHSLDQWDRIAARVVPMRWKTVIGGGLLPFDHEMSETLIGIINEIAASAREELPALIREVAEDMDDSVISEAADMDTVLTAVTPCFSAVWLDSVLERTLQPESPAFRNGDGDELLFSTVRYPLTPGTRESDVRTALAEIPVLRQASETFWNWIGEKSAGTKATSEENPVGMLVTKTEDGALVLGNLELGEGTLTLSVNSHDRVERGRALLEAALEGLIGEPVVETKTVEQMMAEQPDDDADTARLDLPPEEERAMIHADVDRHYVSQLEEPIPSLGDVSPVEAVKTAEGRRKVVDWLKLLENYSAKRPADDALANYDFTWMWERLGVAHMRR